jgi:tRNA(fMet)-specific endonuclease VapC
VSESIQRTGRYLLDTNVAAAILNDKIELRPRFGRHLDAFLNTNVVGELHYGAEKSSRVEENLAKIHRLIALCPVFVCDEETARHYASIKNLLRRKGRPIPENDIWIAASARQHGLTVATRDGHFDFVDDLSVEHW